MSLSLNELKSFLDEKVDQYNSLSFIAPDPISIPHQFSQKKDIEISGFLAATIAWGKREMIIKNSNQIIKAHKGTILVESEKGKGTTFTIKIPV